MRGRHRPPPAAPRSGRRACFPLGGLRGLESVASGAPVSRRDQAGWSPRPFLPNMPAKSRRTASLGDLTRL